MEIGEILNELDGNGLNQEDLFTLTKELTTIAEIKERIVHRLSNTYSEAEVNEMISVVKRPNMQQILMKEFLSSLSKREKECYFRHTFEKMTFSSIAKELGVSRSMVQQSIERARKKLVVAAS